MSNSPKMATQRYILTNAIYTALALILLATYDVDADAQASQFIASQNAARARLRLKSLVWDAKLARYAQWWANQRRYDCALVHSNGPYGENIFWGSGSGWTPAQAALGWLSEAKNYNYYANACVRGQMCGHYTQIVWRKTQRIGCARAVCFGGAGVFMICEYDPPGNFLGQRPY